MSITEISIHRCIGLRIARHYPKINNAITIEFLTEGGGDVPILAFGLPRHITDKLMELLRDEDTDVRRDDPKPMVVDDEELDRLLTEELGGAAA